MNIYEFIENCKEEGLDAYEAELEYEKACQEEREAFKERYENDPFVNAGWAQQDLIDMYRFER